MILTVIEENTNVVASNQIPVSYRQLDFTQASGKTCAPPSTKSKLKTKNEGFNE
jgi:hypothetical protein